jgi:acyl-CoA thioesterase-1
MSVSFCRMMFLSLALGLAGLHAAEPAASGKVEPRTIIFFGDSLTAGLGLENPAAQAFPGVIQQKINNAHLAWRTVNAGLSGETTAGGLRRVDWILRQPADIFVLALGGNDGLRGIDPAVSRLNLQGIIDRVRVKYPAAKIVLTGMQMPPNLGPDYTHAFAAMYPELAEKNHASLVPFLLEGVGLVPELNQRDGIHPTAAGHAIVAETIWKTLHPLL